MVFPSRLKGTIQGTDIKKRRSLLRRPLFFSITVVISALLLRTTSWSQGSSIYIRVGEATLKKSLIAVPPFQFHGSPAVVKNYDAIGAELYKTVVNDLETTGLFQFLKPDSFLEDPQKTGLTPAPGNPKGFSFENWSSIGTEFLIKSGFTVLSGQLQFETYVYYVPRAKLVFGKKYSGSEKDLRRVAHIFSNDVVKELTGKEGMFLSQVVLSSDRVGKGWKEIYTMDWDGNNLTKISDHRSIAISPAWSPDGNLIAYTAYVFHPNWKSRNADLFLYDLKKGTRKLISARKGINSGASFLPDGSGLLLTLSERGNPDIFRMTLEGTKIWPITFGPRGAMNVEPVMSPDGNHIAFSSDRSGRPMIYIMNRDGAGAKRVTFAGRYNSTPAWSPDGKKLLFAGFDEGHFDIFMMDSTGYNMVRLTTARKMNNNKYSNNEDPVFSPDGRHVMFVSDRTGSKQIYIINLDGTNERRITFDRFNYFKPKWVKSP